MTPQITVKAFKCNRCGHRWVPRKSTTDSKYVPRTCGSCKSPLWDSKRKREYYMQKGKKHWRNVASVIAIAGFMALLLVMTPAVSYAAKAAETGGGSTSSNNDKGSSDTGSSHDSGSDGGGTTDNPSHSTDNSKTVDDGFTSKDGPQPPFAIGKDGRPVKDGGAGSTIPHCLRNPNTNSCNPEDCSHIHGICRIPFPVDDRIRHHHDHDHDVRIIQKTVIVHDRNNTPQTIIIRQNPTSGACLVTAQQIADTPDIVRQLLDQCNSVTIVSSGGVGVTHSGGGASTATATARAG